MKETNYREKMANGSKNMVLLLNYCKSKAENATCSKRKVEEANCSKNLEVEAN